MKGVVLGICPDATLVDITHDVAAARHARPARSSWPPAYRYFPAGTIFLVVVDPGVGSARRGIAAEAGDYRFVAPDNGVLTLVFDETPPQARRRADRAPVRAADREPHVRGARSIRAGGRLARARASSWRRSGAPVDRSTARAAARRTSDAERHRRRSAARRSVRQSGHEHRSARRSSALRATSAVIVGRRRAVSHRRWSSHLRRRRRRARSARSFGSTRPPRDRGQRRQRRRGAARRGRGVAVRARASPPGA